MKRISKFNLKNLCAKQYSKKFNIKSSFSSVVFKRYYSNNGNNKKYIKYKDLSKIKPLISLPFSIF